MGSQKSEFSIREEELAKVLEISVEELDKIVAFFDADPSDEWELKEGYHFIYLNRALNERAFSQQGAYAIAKYMDQKQPKNLLERIREFITRHKERIRNAFISKKIQENCTSLTVKNNRHFLSRKDVISILCTSPARLDKAFGEIQRTHTPMKIYEDFEDIDGVRYYSFSGFYRLAQHLAQTLTVKDRRSWCQAIEIVGRKTFKLILDDLDSREKRIAAAMNAARKRDHNTCQITGAKRTKGSRVNIVVHHIYSREHYPHLAASVDNLITLSEEIHQNFHTWNGGFKKPCTPDHLIQFVIQFYPDNYDVIMKLNRVKTILDPQI